jgi:N12 class adenine-specific DNA methylase
MALEGPDGAPAAIFRERTTRAILDPGVMALASNALYVCLDRKGAVDLDWIAAAVGRPRASVEEELAGQIFRTPAGVWETADEYLSGNVRKKLQEAQALLPFDPSLAANVAALEGALPPPLLAGDIQARLGAGWIPEDVVVEFVAHLIPAVGSAAAYSPLRARYLEVTAEWFLEGMSYEARRSLENTQRWGSKRRSAEDLILDCLNSKIPVISDTVEYFEDGKVRSKQVRNNDETLIAQGKLQDIKDAWAVWIWTDAARADRLAKIYNEKFNGFRVRQFDGAHLTFPGLTQSFNPYPAQLAAVARSLRASQDNPAYIHEVGAGKTAAGVMTAVKSIQLGLARRVLSVVPKHLVGQWRDAFTSLFPGELNRLIVADDNSFKKEHRAAFLAKIATSNASYVVITYEQFKVIPLSEKVLNTSLEAELNEVRAERENMRTDHETTSERPARKRLEAEFKRREAAVEKYRVAFKGRAAAASREDHRVITFEDLAVDLLLVVEVLSY